VSIIDALLGTQAVTGAAQNALGFPMPAPGTGAQFNLPVTQQQMGVQPQQGPSKFRNFLGALGDALMVGHGGQPLYHQRMQQQQTQGALQGFLQDPDAAIAALMQVDAPKAVELYTQLHQRAAPTELQRDYEYLKGVDPSLAEQFIHNKTEGAPLIANNGDGTLTIIPRNMVGASPAPPSPPAPGAVEEGYRFKGGDASKQRIGNQ
jgi:hypothetical protein